MYAFEILFSMVVLRLVLPIGILLLIGEWLRSRQRGRFQHR
jgi:hypothetical protein